MLIEMSQEMFDFDSDGFLQSEKCLQFIKAYFERCKFEANTHEVEISLFGRLYYPQVNSKESLLKFAKETLKKPDLSEKELEKIGSF